MITFQRGPVRIAELWFDEEPDGPVDILRFRQRPKLPDGATGTPFLTRLVDLTRPADEILTGFKKDTQYEIRRAASKDRLIYAPTADTVAALPRFREFYDAFARRKGLPLIDADVLGRYAGAGMLAFSAVTLEDRTPLVWHAYIRRPGRVRLLHSASRFRESGDSAFRNMVGRANRFHHWKDILHFKVDGIAIYDLGGWYEGTEDVERLKVNAFKEEFGGAMLEEFDGELLVTWKGRLYATLRMLKSAGDAAAPPPSRSGRAGSVPSGG
jgi:hypothetical protein